MQLLTNNNNNLPSSEKDLPVCPENVPVLSTGVPGISDDQRLEISTNKGKSFRIFQCIDDKPVSYSEYDAKISDIKGDWWGEMFYQDGFPIFRLNWANPYSDGNKIESRTVVSFKEYVEIPAPNPTSDLPWARYPVMSDDGKKPSPFKYIERAYTKGGVPPATCGGQREVRVPYEAYYYFYACKDALSAVSPDATPVPMFEPSPTPLPPQSPEPVLVQSPEATTEPTPTPTEELAVAVAPSAPQVQIMNPPAQSSPGSQVPIEPIAGEIQEVVTTEPSTGNASKAGMLVTVIAAAAAAAL